MENDRIGPVILFLTYSCRWEKGKLCKIFFQGVSLILPRLAPASVGAKEIVYASNLRFIGSRMLPKLRARNMLGLKGLTWKE